MRIDCRGEVCPLPVIKTKKTLDTIEKDGVVEVWVDNPEASENIAKLLESKAYPYTVLTQGTDYRITITKGAARTAETAAESQPVETPINTVVVIATEKMGEGDEVLGRALLKAFINALAEAEHPPKALVFYNGGVHFAVEGSSVLEDVKTLSNRGVDVLSCGACLKHYGLTDSLQAGRVSNMYEIAGMMLTHRVVRP